jgi:hypothetical protein
VTAKTRKAKAARKARAKQHLAQQTIKKADATRRERREAARTLGLDWEKEARRPEPREIAPPSVRKDVIKESRQLMRRANDELRKITVVPGKKPDEGSIDAENAAAVPASTVENGRGTCPECETRQKVKKDGTMGKHKFGGNECAGTNLPAL